MNKVEEEHITVLSGRTFVVFRRSSTPSFYYYDNYDDTFTAGRSSSSDARLRLPTIILMVIVIIYIYIYIYGQTSRSPANVSTSLLLILLVLLRKRFYIHGRTSADFRRTSTPPYCCCYLSWKRLYLP